MREKLAQDCVESSWNDKVMKTFILEKLFKTAVQLQETRDYYDSSCGNITLSHKLYFAISRFSISKLFNIPIMGLYAFVDMRSMTRDLDSSLNEIAEWIGRIYADEPDAICKCAVKYNTNMTSGDLLYDIEHMDVDKISRLHGPSLFMKHGLELILYPVLISVFLYAQKKHLTFDYLKDLILDSITSLYSYTRTWIINPLLDLYRIVRYPHDRPLTIMTVDSVEQDRLVPCL